MSAKSKEKIEVEAPEEAPAVSERVKDEIRDVQGVQSATDGTLTDNLDELSAAELLLLALRATTVEQRDDYMARRARRF